MKRVGVITGASSGIGAAAASALAEHGWHVVVVGRNRERTDVVAAATSGDPLVADFDRLDDVRALADTLNARYDRIDLLANNAGGLVRTRSRTPDGHERSIQLNHLAPFLLTCVLLPRLEASDGRVIATSSIASRWGPVDVADLGLDRRPWRGGWPAYGVAKLANVLHAAELARRSTVWSASFHPGYVATSWGSDTPLLRFAHAVSRDKVARSPASGAAPLVHLATVETPPAESGTFFHRMRPHGRTHPQAHDRAAAAALWDRSAELVHPWLEGVDARRAAR